MSKPQFPRCARPSTYAVAARSSAVVLEAEGHREQAKQLRQAATQVEAWIAAHPHEDRLGNGTTMANHPALTPHQSS